MNVPVQASVMRTVRAEIAREAYLEYSQQWPGQTFERLHERGGFAWDEMAMLLYLRCQRLQGKPMRFSELSRPTTPTEGR